MDDREGQGRTQTHNACYSQGHHAKYVGRADLPCIPATVVDVLLRWTRRPNYKLPIHPALIACSHDTVNFVIDEFMAVTENVSTREPERVSFTLQCHACNARCGDPRYIPHGLLTTTFFCDMCVGNMSAIRMLFFGWGKMCRRVKAGARTIFKTGGDCKRSTHHGSLPRYLPTKVRLIFCNMVHTQSANAHISHHVCEQVWSMQDHKNSQ